MIRQFFRKAVGKPANTFDEVDLMQTRKLLPPDMTPTGTKEDKTYIRFSAKRTAEGLWLLNFRYNFKQSSDTFTLASELFGAAIEKHSDQKLRMNTAILVHFDAALLIMKDMEESILKKTGQLPGDEPDHHFMAAYRLMPKQFQEGIDDLYYSRNLKKPLMEYPATLAAVAEKPEPTEKKPHFPPPNGPLF